MKKLFTMAAAIIFTAGISAFATETDPVLISKASLNYHLSFKKIIIENDISLVLEENCNKRLDFAGNEADIEKVDWKIKDNVLYLRSKKGSLKNKVTVTVSVQQLKELNIIGESTVRSVGQLGSANLYIYLEGEGHIALSNFGPIYLIGGDNTELDIMRSSGDVITTK